MARLSRAKKQPQPVATTSGGSVGSSNKSINENNNNNPTSTIDIGDGDEGGGVGGEQLLERLRILLHRLQLTTEILQNWPEARGDSARVHADTCTELIAAIRKIALGVRGVERHVNGTGPVVTVAAASTVGSTRQMGDGGDNNAGGGTTESTPSATKEASSEDFRTYLETSCPIPLDLLDLLDVGPQQNPFGLHPSCYARGLMEESLRQLARLERRRRALRMLANSIEKGMMKNDSLLVDDASGSGKRKSDVDSSSEVLHSNKRCRVTEEEPEPILAS